MEARSGAVIIVQHFGGALNAAHHLVPPADDFIVGTSMRSGRTAVIAWSSIASLP